MPDRGRRGFSRSLLYAKAAGVALLRLRRIGSLFCLGLILSIALRFAGADETGNISFCKANSFDSSALRGDKARADWLLYKSAKNGLSFRYPASMRIEERDPAPFRFDKSPDLIVDLRGDEVNNPDVIAMRFICNSGEKTPAMARAKARALLKTQPEEDPTGYVTDGATGSVQVDGHEAILSCGCGRGRGACRWSVLTLQPRECLIFPMAAGKDFTEILPPPHDDAFPLLSIINTIHFDKSTAK
jgi:hypothetical protein